MDVNLFNNFIYVISYYQLDNLLKMYIYNNFDPFKSNPIIFYPVINTANVFILGILSFLTIYLCYNSNKNYNIYSLSFIYMKYIFDNIYYFNKINLFQHDFKRSIMWLFTTPLILKLYCDINNLKLTDINYSYHLTSNLIYVFLFPIKNTYYNIHFIILLSIPEIYFIYQLFNFIHYKHTKLIIYIWFLFTIIVLIETLNIINLHDLQISYLLSDMIAKITFIIIMHNHEKEKEYIQNNMDIQSISLLTSIKKTITHFQKLSIITSKCDYMIKSINTDLYQYYMPFDNTQLKLELLKKILPMELEEDYLSQLNNYKNYENICVLFIDIVSYTEIAKIYDETIIYKLLNEIYTRFDNVVIRYTNLQKIETIGDAYMVVSDIYTNNTSAKDIVLLAIELLKEIKFIKSPNNKVLQLRIGIHIGKVVVGILGIEIPRLCIIGNTVNIANRIQTTADPDVIQISEQVYNVIKHDEISKIFKLKENVNLKNIGSINTYVSLPAN